MSLIYISSKKRLDSRWLWLISLALLLLIAGAVYLAVNNYPTPKKTQNNEIKSSQSLTSSSLDNSSSPQNQSNPMTADAQKTESKSEALTSASSSAIMSAPNADTNPKSDPIPMPATNNQAPSDIMKSNEPTKPSLSMDEILNQTKNAQPVDK